MRNFRNSFPKIKKLMKQLMVSAILKEDNLKEDLSVGDNMDNKQQTAKNGTDMPENKNETKNAGTRSHIAKREMLVAQARQFNLLSNVFMSVALDDKAACLNVYIIYISETDLWKRRLYKLSG